MLRTPLLAISKWYEWGDGLCVSACRLDDAASLRQAFDADVPALRERLRLGLTPPVMEALAVGSSSLVSAIRHWEEAPADRRGSRVEAGLVAYFSRMSGRPTPTGLFAATSIGRVDAVTRLELPSFESVKRRVSLDARLLCTLADHLRSQSPPAERRLRANPTLYRLGAFVRYLRPVRGTDRVHDRAYELETCEVPASVMDVLLATAGARPFAAWVDLVRRRTPDVRIDEARDCVATLAESGLLLDQFEPLLTASTSVDALCANWEGVAAAELAIRTLRAWDQGRMQLEQQPLGVPASAYDELASVLRGLPSDVDTSTPHHVELLRSGGGASLSRRVVDELRTASVLINQLVSRSDGAWAYFARRFTARFGDEEVPLLLALDPDLGVGFTMDSRSPIEEAALGFRVRRPTNLWDADDKWSPLDARLLALIQRAVADGTSEIVLSHGDLADVLQMSAAPPEEWSVLATVLADSAQAVDDGNYRLLVEGYSDSTTMWGRFGHACDQARAALQGIVDRESSQTDAIVAEVVHWPAGSYSVGNVMRRPAARAYEIPLLAESLAPASHQIPPTDLWVRVTQGRVVLRSARLDREVKPISGTAHRYWQDKQLPLYQFLAGVNTQELDGRRPFLGHRAFQALPHIPRIRVGNAYISAASWLLDEPTMRSFRCDEPIDRFLAVQAWRQRCKIPRYVSWLEGDKRLPVDLDNALSVLSFVRHTRRRDTTRVRELLPARGDVCVRDGEAGYVHEVVVPFSRPGGRKQGPVGRPAVRRPTVDGFARRVCVYLKLYRGPGLVNETVLSPFADAARKWIDAGWASHWHYVRYHDPDPHVRVRIFPSGRRGASRVRQAAEDLAGRLLDAGELARVAFDTYQPEIERYGGARLLPLVEQLFWHDSDSCERLIACQAADATGLEDWLVAIRSVHLWLCGWLSPSERVDFTRRTRDAYAAEFEIAGELRQALAQLFRARRTSVDAALDGCGIEVERVLERRTLLVGPIVEALRAQADGLAFESIGRDVVHMHVNRLLPVAQRASEMVLYECLHREYTSRAERAKASR